MMNLMSTTNAPSYAAIRNARFKSSKSHVVAIAQRWKETYNALSSDNKLIVDANLEAAKAEFRRTHPTLKKWKDLLLAESKLTKMNNVHIDGTMQRQLDIFWVLTLLNKFVTCKAVPIQVYRPDPTKDEFLAWDGQHTLVLLWLIAVHIMEEDPDTIDIPVNIYHTHSKAEMRSTFLTGNTSEGKKQLEQIDVWDQMVYGVRVDGAKNPLWVEVEKKQAYIEQAGLFVSSKKFNDTDKPGAISRLQEINKLSPESVKYLAKYLALATQLSRAVDEKEMVMMGKFFDRCKLDGVALSDAYIQDLFHVVNTVWDCDFSPTGKFWIKASNAYAAWHTASNALLASLGYPVPTARFKKEPSHGMPYLIAQLKNSLGRPVPKADSSSSFWPLTTSLV